MTSPQHFTAAQLARALGMSKRAVLLALRDVPGRSVPGQGGEARAWPLAVLPPQWCRAMAATAQRQCFRDAEHLLSAAPQPWLPCDRTGRVVPLAEVSDYYLTRAKEMRAALLPALAAQHELDRAALIALACRHGYAKSEKQLFRDLERVTTRDRGAEDWTRLELYLEESSFRHPRPQATPSHDAARYTHHELAEIVGALENKTEPTPDDRAWLLHEAFNRYEILSTAQADDKRTIKATLIDYLHATVPALSLSRQALRGLFNRKLAQWINGGRTIDALRDSRQLASGNFRRPDFTADEAKIRDQAILLGGDEAKAYNLLRERGTLSVDFCAYYAHNPRLLGSGIPKTVRDNITGPVESVLPLLRGPKTARMAGPFIKRDWSAVKAGDWLCADDVSWNHYFKQRLPDGRWEILRGECLLLVDLLTDYPLTFLLIGGKYNGQHVRSLFLKGHDLHGLPRAGYWLERGVWKSRFVVGEKRGRKDDEAWQAAHWRNCELGLSDPRIGLQFHHATTPRSKPIEGLFHHLQDRMRCIKGFVGFGERQEQMERMQKLIARAHRNDESALAEFVTQDEWSGAITKVLEEHMHRPGRGERLDGRTPAEAWGESVLRAGLRRLPDDSRHLLSTHEKIVRLHPTRGIVITVPGQQSQICYQNEHTDRLLHARQRQVRVWVNVESPLLITACDMNRTQFFSAKGQAAPATSASREHLASLASDRRAGSATARAIFGQLQHEVVSTITRDDEHDDATKEAGRHVAIAAAEHHEQESAEQREIRSIRRRAGKLGRQITADLSTPRARRAASMELDGLESKHAENEA